MDVQVKTAHLYPRDLRRSVDSAIALATIDTETAQKCGYALPRGGKPITGASVHLARLLVACWGNFRAEAHIEQVTATQVIARGTAWDLENNSAQSFEVRRGILSRDGRRYQDDMITVTGNAACAIAYRNAVFSVIPSVFVTKVYKAAMEKVTGDLSDENALIARRAKALQYFRDEYGIQEEEVVRLCGKETVTQIRAEEIALLIGIQQSIADGDTTVTELMAPYRRETAKEKLSQVALKSTEGKKKVKAAGKEASDVTA